MTLAVTGTSLATALAGNLQFQSGEKQVTLLELFTSEGCSSCPPAENWLAGLKHSPDLWTNFVPVAFHVDYWNSLGWKDRWSSPEFSERERAYAAVWRSDSIYTPCFVANGREWRNWFGLRKTPGASGENTGVLTATSADTNLWSATFIPANSSSTRFDLHAAVLAGELNSDVTAGENRGRHLHHEFSALNLLQIGMTTKDGAAMGKFITDTTRFNSEKELALAVWITRAGELEPIQATGGWLIPPGATTKR